MAVMKKARKGPKVGSGPVVVRSGVSGQARLSIQVVDGRYTPESIVHGLNAGELRYGAGQISRAGHVVARYHILDVDDRLENFQVVG